MARTRPGWSADERTWVAALDSLVAKADVIPTAGGRVRITDPMFSNRGCSSAV